MSRWRELAQRLKVREGARDDSANRDSFAVTAVNVPVAPIFRRVVLHVPDAWSAAIAPLDSGRAPAGIAPSWWRTVLADALWIARNHAEAAAAFGWSASDLFGINPAYGQGYGGLADRLDGARRLTFTAGIAHWQDDGCEGWLWQHTLNPKPLLWEIEL